MIIKRGSENRGTLADRFYPGIIQRVQVKNEKSRFSMDEEPVVLNLSIQVDSPVGPVMLCSQMTANLAPKSKLTQLLEYLGMLPEIGGEYDTDSLVGMFVTVLVERVVKNGATYTNVNRIKKRDERVAV